MLELPYNVPAAAFDFSNRGGDPVDLFKVELSDGEIGNMSNLALAHIGDGVYELMVRTHLALEGRETNSGLHRATVAMVAATAQAAAAERIEGLFTQEERQVYRRGRNAKVHSVPHGASFSEYHTATALEALFGYLYLKGRTDRLNELFDAILEAKHVS